MGTNISEDNAKFADVIKRFQVATTNAANGRLVYAGNLWPLGVVDQNAPKATPAGRQMRREIDYAFQEARAMVTAGYIQAAAACRGDDAAGLLMTKWFGTRDTGPGKNDWWLGAHRILGQLQAKLSQDINVYYRGDDSLIGKPNDYPGESGKLTQDDVAGYAETSADATDGNIGLCKLFFRRESGGVFKTAQKGRDSIGGCLVHELSHNYCGTEDHDSVRGGNCYGERDCKELAEKRRRCAWYNADNIEYFCEDAYYGVVAAKASINTGSTNSVKNIRAAHQQVIAALKPTAPSGQPRSKGPSSLSGTGKIALMRAQLQAAAVTRNPSLPVSLLPSPGKNKVP